jgi:hypothetical protein
VDTNHASSRHHCKYETSTCAVDTFVGESCPYERSGGMGVGMGRRNGRRVVVGQWSFGWELGASSPVLVVMGRIAAVLAEHVVLGIPASTSWLIVAGSQVISS